MALENGMLATVSEASGEQGAAMKCGRVPRLVLVSVLMVPCTQGLSPSASFAQCKALFSSVPVPGTIADAGASCVTSTLVDQGNGTVTDRANHLLWTKGAPVPWPGGSLQDARNYCNILELGGVSDWYLPDVAQLQTLLPPGTCHAVMNDCGSGDPDIPSLNGVLFSDSLVSPESYYCPAGFGWAMSRSLLKFEPAAAAS